MFQPFRGIARSLLVPATFAAMGSHSSARNSGAVAAAVRANCNW